MVQIILLVSIKPFGGRFQCNQVFYIFEFIIFTLIYLFNYCVTACVFIGCLNIMILLV